MLRIEQIWRKRTDNNRYNTSYPLHPSDWIKYRVPGPLPFSDTRCAFYIHIPFCARLCSFCEYTRMRCPEEHLQIQYLKTLAKDVNLFCAEHSVSELYGFDIGGGTPTVLSNAAFSFLIELYHGIMERFTLSNDYEPSIEGTFHSVSEQKLTQAVKAGIKRLSLGLQSSEQSVLLAHNRENLRLEHMRNQMEMIRSCGVRKINLDLMYGLNGQSHKSINTDVEYIATLNPEQVTLYEWRTNMLRVAEQPRLEQNYAAYAMYYDALKKLGYNARFGQNTFSRSTEDEGCSSYLRHRMLSASAYKGFGISAQSMSSAGISYNLGKNTKILPTSASSFEIGDTYVLPPRELAAKYIAISAYYGGFSLNRLSELMQCRADVIFEEQICFVLSHGLMERCGDILYITQKGYRHYGATFSLFYLSMENE